VPEYPIRRIIDSYRGLPRLYSRIRFSILRQNFLEEIGQYLPRRGRILDLGSGFGLFSLYFALCEPERELIGVERSRERVALARASAQTLSLANVRYDCCDVLDWKGDGPFDAVYLLDLVHHLPVAEVAGFLEAVCAQLRPGGTLILKEVADRPHAKRLFALLLDRLMVGREPIRYWPPAELSALLENLGFDVKRHRMNDIFPFPHILYVCRAHEPEPLGAVTPAWLREITE
jgi:2-polyprenyl-3-methyl-5-hydroxy-6-metoxy-1,4-benzoquinol methylase